MKFRSFILAVLALASASCSRSPTQPPVFGTGEVRVLFVGNSLTYLAQDIPVIVQALADASGRSMTYLDYSRPGWSLNTHVFSGIGSEIRRLQPHMVVLQQGPSDDPDARAQLVADAQAIAEVATFENATTAMFMVWPPESQPAAFAAVRAAYLDAAVSSGSRFIPAGSAWLEALTREPSLQLYAADEHHPTYLGALIAAHTIFAVLFDVDPAAIPALQDGVSAEVLATVRASVAAALATP